MLKYKGQNTQSAKREKGRFNPLCNVFETHRKEVKESVKFYGKGDMEIAWRVW